LHPPSHLTPCVFWTTLQGCTSLSSPIDAYPMALAMLNITEGRPLSPLQVPPAAFRVPAQCCGPYHLPLVRSKAAVGPWQFPSAPRLNFIQLHCKLCQTVEVLVMFGHWGSGPDALPSTGFLLLITIQTCLPVAINCPHFTIISVIHNSSDVVLLGCPACCLSEVMLHAGGEDV